MSATLSGRVPPNVLKSQYNYTHLNLGNDRPNLSLVVRAIRDLDFVIPNNITVGSEMIEHLYEIAPPGFREAGTYTAQPFLPNIVEKSWRSSRPAMCGS
ncbi:hypothetical protein CVT26_013084 [Gymnopilus dilepis]|uniref:Uncharacterized protein n=1 Tax=Gymnopilus dilepis TaxID=231916 RepID=A0A409Y4G5_9AGAR|nr:hypothetical protein CVT26_013084 [Gymnopilus dilepis]